MIEIKIIAVTGRSDESNPRFVPIRMEVPVLDYYDREILENIIRLIDGEVVGWDYGYPIITKFEDDYSKAVYEITDWEKAPLLSCKGVFDNTDLWQWESTFCRQRVRELEPVLARSEESAEKYIKRCRNIDWIKWTDEELVLSPVFMFNYALKVCKGRLPDHLDNAMNMESFKNPDSKYVKRYFKTKRYRVRSGKSLLKTTKA